MQIKLKHFLQMELNEDLRLGEKTQLMIWSPVHHFWVFYESWSDLMKVDQKFLLKQPVVRIGLRNDQKDRIAIFLKDYGNEGNRKRYARLRN